MKVTLLDKVLFRVPQFPVDGKLTEYWPQLKASICNASDYFYSIIKDLEAENIALQSESVKNTIAKYFNRARFRATPFGSFGSIGMLTFNDHGNGKLLISTERTRYIFEDWEKTRETSLQWKNKPLEELQFITNDTWYRAGDVIRYVFQEENKFELCDIPYYTEVEEILEACRKPIPFLALSALTQSIGLAKDELSEVIKELLDCGLLFTQYQPNIIGKDYFKRIDSTPTAGQKEYEITNCEVLENGIGKELFCNMEGLISLLAKQPVSPKSVDLDKFITAFIKRYDKALVPILSALDPFHGIGYGDYDNNLSPDSLLAGIEPAIETQEPDKSMADKVRQYLISASLKEKDIINLEDFLDNSSPENTTPLPNTMSALVSIHKNLVVIEQLGGTSANIMAGRFTIENESLLDFCNEIAAQEQEANPEVLYFDIAYCGEPEVDNVNRRAQIYPYQVNILNYLDLPGSIPFNDIYITVHNDELILFSKIQGKRLIPRLSTAYSYSRSQLPLFRFLCDIQTQDINFAPLPDLKLLFAGQKFIPRLQYKNIVCSTAKWLVSKKDVDCSFEAFSNYLTQRNLPQFIKIGEGDQTLLLDIEVTDDRRLLQSILKVRDTLWVQEGFAPDNAHVRDSHGRMFQSEYVISFAHNERIYAPYFGPGPISKPTRTYYPGDTWLSYEIFCHPQNIEPILLDYLYPAIKQCSPYLEGWLFLRYNEGGDHMRFRLKVRKNDDYGAVLKVVTEQLLKATSSELIKDIRLCRYNRELERYGGEQIDKVERIFYEDSEATRKFLDTKPNEEERRKYSFTLLHSIGNQLLGTTLFAEYVDKYCNLHNKEHRINRNAFKQINRSFKTFMEAPQTSRWGTIDKAISELADSYVGMLREVKAPWQHKLMFSNLMHMHINRMFCDEQRKQEMILYNYLQLSLKRVTILERV